MVRHARTVLNELNQAADELRGLQTGSGASAVGASTTNAVVSGIVLITIGDGIFAIVYYAIGI